MLLQDGRGNSNTHFVLLQDGRVQRQPKSVFLYCQVTVTVTVAVTVTVTLTVTVITVTGVPVLPVRGGGGAHDALHDLHMDQGTRVTVTVTVTVTIATGITAKYPPKATASSTDYY